MVTIRDLGPLAADDGGRALWRAWIRGDGPGPGAAEECRALLAGGDPPTEAAPLLAAGWRPRHAEDLGPGAAAALGALAAGRAVAVVTGQQPGRLAGPLYTLFKTATAVKVAAALTSAGLPAVPVYWSGDADDDLDEAFAPLCWNPARKGFLDLDRGPGRKGPGRTRPMVGRLRAAQTVRAEAAWLAGHAGPEGSVAAGLADLWRRAVAEDWTWARLQAAALALLFPGAGLLVVSGDDPAVHEAAAPLYARILPDLPDLGSLAARRGRELEAAGFHAQLGGPALVRPLFRVEGDRRVPAGPDPGRAPVGTLRPGVLLRSPVQDWLLRPAAVVAGPGELAYLKQLEPLYRHLGIPRCPLVPRLAGWLATAGAPDPPPAPDPAAAAALARRAGAVAEEELRRILGGELGVEDGRAADLARGRARRYVRGVAAMLHDEAQRRRRALLAGGPGWLHPDGAPQERTLAAGCAAALWGRDLLAAVDRAAAEHLERGRRGDWRRFRWDVPDPAGPKGAT